MSSVDAMRHQKHATRLLEEYDRELGGAPERLRPIASHYSLEKGDRRTRLERLLEGAQWHIAAALKARGNRDV